MDSQDTAANAPAPADSGAEPLPEGSAPATTQTPDPGHPGDTGADPSSTPGVVQQPVENTGIQGAGDPNVPTAQPPTVSAGISITDESIAATVDTCAISPSQLFTEWNAALTRVFGQHEDGTTAVPAELRTGADAAVVFASAIAAGYSVDALDRVQLVTHFREPAPCERAVVTVTVVVAQPGFSEVTAVEQEQTP